VFIANAWLGPEASALLSALRTFSSLPERFTNLLSGVYTAEAAVENSGRDERVLRLLRIGTELVIITFALAAVCYGLVGQRIFAAWTRGSFPLDWILFSMLFASSACRAWWNTNYALLLGVLKHRVVTIIFVLISFVGVGLLMLFGGYWKLQGIALLLLSADVVMAVVTGLSVARVTGVPIRRALGPAVRLATVWGESSGQVRRLFGLGRRAGSGDAD
jgi:O-antigen/teichoic acid export membrane protein